MSAGLEQLESDFAARTEVLKKQRDTARLRTVILQGKLWEMRKRVQSLPPEFVQCIFDGLSVSEKSWDEDEDCEASGDSHPGGNSLELAASSNSDQFDEEGEEESPATEAEGNSASSSSASSLLPSVVALQAQIHATQFSFDLDSFRKTADTSTRDHLESLLSRAREACQTLAKDINDAAISKWAQVLQRALAGAVKGSFEAIKADIMSAPGGAEPEGGIVWKAMPWHERAALIPGCQ